MIKIKEAVLVEGKYDKHTLSGVADTLILTCEGFAVFNHHEKRVLLKRLAETRGLIILTDSDGAGFLIRGRLKGMLPKEGVKHAYIPDEYGKEKRKAVRSKEGKLGVEGMSRGVLERSLRQAGATVLGEGVPNRGDWLTKTDLYAMGLSGDQDSSKKRQTLLKRLSLPEHMSANAMLAALNALYTPEQWLEITNENPPEKL